MTVSWLDVVIGARMLIRYKGLALAGGLALAIAIGLGAGWHNVWRDYFHPTLPLPEADRLVEIQVHDAESNRDEPRMLHDFLAWSKEARTMAEVGAYRTLERNLMVTDANPEQVRVAEITVAGLRMARVPPLLGRPLLDADAQPGAPPVVVISHRVWQRQFGGRPEAIGRTIQLGRTQLTVVGVMPEGFGFPRNHRIWIPLQLRESGYSPLEGPAVSVFGRLAPGIQPTQATDELAALTSRVAGSSPDTHQHLRPVVFSYGTRPFQPSTWLDFLITNGPVLLVLLVACVNVGTLVYARTATREAEIAVRHAIGASRGRIVGQLFVEALVFAGIAAGVGLLVADGVLRLAFSWLGDDWPFWMRPGLKFSTVFYGALLAVVAAAIFGVLPALKATRSVGVQLKISGAGGATLRFGKVWTAAMIAEVAITMLCLVPAQGISLEAIRDHLVRRQFPGERYLAVELAMDREAPASEGGTSASAERVNVIYRELERRVAQEPGVQAITFGDHVPGMIAPAPGAELESPAGAAAVQVPNVWVVATGPGYFTTFDRQILSGRDFHGGDLVPGARSVIVNENFSRLYTAGASPVGRRIRLSQPDSSQPGPWLDIVGMARDIGTTPTGMGEAPHVYRATSPAELSRLMMGVRVAGDPSVLARRLREIVVDVDPTVRLADVQTLADLIWNGDKRSFQISAGVIGVVSLGVFLSAAGIFSLMSVSVARRTREIALRVALGAGRGRILAGVFWQALLLIGIGIGAGSAIIGLLFFGLAEEPASAALVVRVIGITSTTMLAAGLLGCVSPARRALRINPAEALKEA